MKRILGLFFCLILVFSLPGCRREEPASNDLPSVALTHIYDSLPLHGTEPFPVGFASAVETEAKQRYRNWGYDWFCTEDKIGFVHLINAETVEKALYFFDWEGNYLGMEMLPENVGGHGTYQHKPAADGGWIFLQWDDTETIKLCRTDHDGNILAETEVPELEENNTRTFLAYGGEQIVVLYDNRIWVFDDALAMTASYHMDNWYCSLAVDENGMILARNQHGLLERIDPATGSTVCVWETEAENGTLIEQYPGEGYDLYQAEETGLYGVNLTEDGDEEKTLLLSWNNSGFTRSQTEILYIHSPEQILSRSANNLYGLAETVLLTPAADQTRTEVTLACFRGTEEFYFLQKAAAAFNRESEKYILRLTEYPESVWEPEEAEKRLFAEMEAGRSPDLLVIHPALEAMYRNLDRQGYLTDLTHLSEPLTGSARTAVMVGDHCTRLPLSIRYTTLISAREKESLTAQKLTEWMDTGDTLFSVDTARYLQTCIANSFIDEEAGTASFDSDTFRDYLALLEGMADYTDTDLGKIISGYRGGSTIHAGLPESFAAGKPVFAVFPVRTIEAFGVAELFAGGEYSFCGWPDTSAVTEIPCTFAAPASGQNGDGAAEFLTFLLSDEVQSAALITNESFPVTTSAVELLLQDSCYVFTIGEETAGDSSAGEEYDAVQLSLMMKMETKDERMPMLRMMREVTYTAEMKETVRAFVESTAVSRIPDPTMDAILLEEISAYLSGDRTMEDTVRVLQSRVSTYLAE